ncbi:RNA polymerase sigma-70 factor [Olivibacter ginsenosidimutans]|uniref:RNA polymerase sigma-70 factor n=1 Tax=Olivibacter ginsenosidimutans TaxID=1176537 RepID=A0ABP9BC63_9SPHI
MYHYSDYTDQQLLRLVVANNSVAYTALYERYSDMLYKHALSKLNDVEEAKDVVQELFVNLWDKRHQIHIEHHLPAYLYRALRNKILNIYAHRKVKTLHLASLQEFLDQHPLPTDYKTREKQLYELIENELQSLPKKTQEIFRLSRNQQLSHKEIAIKLHISEKTVKNQVNTALKQLRSKFGLFFFLLYLLK